MLLEPVPDPAVRESHYQEEYYDTSRGERFFPLFEAAVRFFVTLRARAITRREPGPASLLDVGCGRGGLLEHFNGRGWRTLGTQLSRTAADSARRRKGLDVRCAELPDLDVPEGSLQVLTFFHVLEHLPDPALYLRRSRELLEDNGLLVIEVPEHGGLGFRLLRRRHLCFDYPNHLTFFTFLSLRTLLYRTGFRICDSSHFSLEYSPFTTLQNMLNILPGESNRFYRALMVNTEGKSLRAQPLTWLHFLLAVPLSVVALLFSSGSLVTKRGNTMRLFCRKVREGQQGKAGEGPECT